MIHKRRTKTKLKMKQKQITRPFLGKNAHFLWAFFYIFFKLFDKNHKKPRNFSTNLRHLQNLNIPFKRN